MATCGSIANDIRVLNRFGISTGTIASIMNIPMSEVEKILDEKKEAKKCNT